MVRCHLARATTPRETLRYVRLAEFELWRYLMETRHGRVVVVEEVSIWVPEDAALLDSAIGDPELCEPVCASTSRSRVRTACRCPSSGFFARRDLSGGAGRPARALRVRAIAA